MYNDYFYQEQYPKVRVFSSTDRMLREKKKQQKKQQRRKNPYETNVNVRRQRYNQYDNSFKSLNKHGKRISNSCNSILKGMEAIFKLVVLAGIALFSISKYIDVKNSRFDSSYSPYGESSYNGRYEGNDEKTVIKNKIIDEAEKQGVDPAWALAIAEQESHFNPKAKSQAGAMGVFQLMPKTADWLGVKDPWDADQNIKGGIKYLKFLNKYYNGDKWKATAAYNRGQGNIDKDLAKGLDADTYTDRTQTKNGKIGYAQSVFGHYDKYKGEIDKLKEQSKTVKMTDAGAIRRISNGTMVGNYKMTNPNKQRNYIELSERAEAYLKDVGGSGLITSGAEGNHKKGKIMSHESGNKIDVVANGNTNEAWADTAIPFIKNKNTAFICFEDFSKQRFEAIKKIIFSKIDANLQAKCDSRVKYGWGDRGGCFLDYKADYGTGLHLDIGILPTAYSKKQQQEETKIKEVKPANTQKIEDNNNKIAQQKKQENKTTAQPQQNKPSTNVSTSISQQTDKKGNKLIDVGSPDMNTQIKNSNDSYKNGRK